MDIITMIGNTGTYLDSPFHRYDDGVDLAGLDLATLVDLPAEVFHLTDLTTRGIPAEVFLDRDLRGTAVLLHTGFDRHFGTPEYAHGSPFLEAPASSCSSSTASRSSASTPSTSTTPSRAASGRSTRGLLAAGIHVVEHLTRLGELPPAARDSPPRPRGA